MKKKAVSSRVKKVPLRLIAPLRCNRPDVVRRYMAKLRAGERAPAIYLIQQRRGNQYRYRIFDGAHRVRAAKRVGRATINATIIALD